MKKVLYVMGAGMLGVVLWCASTALPAQALTLPSLSLPVIPVTIPPITIPVPTIPLPTIPINLPGIPDPLPGLPIIGNGSTASQPDQASSTLSIDLDILKGLTSTSSPTSSLNLLDAQVVVRPSGLLDINLPWKASSTSIIKHVTDDSSGLFNDSDLITIGASLQPQKMFRTFPKSQDWSNYNKIGFWIYAISPIDAGSVEFWLSETTDGSDVLVQPIRFVVPRIARGTWHYVSFDLPSPGIRYSKILSYGFYVYPNVSLSLNLRPLQLGPALLHHFSLRSTTTSSVPGKTKGIIVRAEDEYGNLLNFGKYAFNGLKRLTLYKLSRVSSTTPGLKIPVSLTFKDGISDPLSLGVALPPIAEADIGITDGEVNSFLGDFSYNLLSLGGGTSTPSNNGGGGSNSVPMSPLHTLISAAPSPAVLGKPVLVSVETRDPDNNPWPIGGKPVVMSITGANPQVLVLKDNGDGTYENEYTPMKMGVDVIRGLIETQPIGSDTDGKSDGTFNLAVADAPSGNGGSGGGGGGGGGSGGGSSSYFGGGYTGSLVSAASTTASGATSTVCSPYLLKFIKRGENNDPIEVTKLQKFLREYETMSAVKITGVYDTATFNAVKMFQDKYVRDVLQPWSTATPTGYVYITTVRKINEIYCRMAPKVQSQPVSAVPTASTCALFTTPQWQGKSGAEVIKIQKMLVENNLMASPSSWGYFGPVTADAVKRFQLKYKDEILTPVGLSQPSGRWLSMSIKKANQMTGCGQ